MRVFLTICVIETKPTDVLTVRVYVEVSVCGRCLSFPQRGRRAQHPQPYQTKAKKRNWTEHIEDLKVLKGIDMYESSQLSRQCAIIDDIKQRDGRSQTEEAHRCHISTRLDTWAVIGNPQPRIPSPRCLGFCHHCLGWADLDTIVDLGCSRFKRSPSVLVSCRFSCRRVRQHTATKHKVSDVLFFLPLPSDELYPGIQV